jgi:ArsR family transcriptional regulator, arsenate/arsenite/antimonite-responsive transcriptional repressor
MVGRSTAEVASAADRRTDTGGVPRVEVFRALGDPTRLAVLDLLAAQGSRCHCDLEVELAVPANRLSFHLKVLRDAGLVGTTRRGRRAHYHLLPGALERVHAALPTPGVTSPDLAACPPCTATAEVVR